MWLTAIYPIKHARGVAQPGDVFEGDAVLVAAGLATSSQVAPPVDTTSTGDTIQISNVDGLAAAMAVKADLGADGKLKASQLPLSALVDVSATGMTLAAGMLKIAQDDGGPDVVVDLNAFATDAEVAVLLAGKASTAQGNLAQTALQDLPSMTTATAAGTAAQQAALRVAMGLGPVASMSLPEAQSAVSGGASSSAKSPLIALEAKIAVLTQTSVGTVRTLVIGDSVSQDISLPLLRPFVRMLGNGGITNGTEQLGWTRTLSGGAAVTTVDDYPTWIGGRWTDIPATGAAVYGWNGSHAADYPLPASGVYRIGYLRRPVAGSFSVQDSPDGTTWTTLSTINTNGADNYVNVTVTGTAGRRYMRILGVTGTVRIVSWMVGSVNGYQQHTEVSIGGSQLQNYMLAPSAVWDSYLTSAAPDLIFVYFKDTANAAFDAALDLLQARIYANCPNADVVYIGPTHTLGTAETIEDNLARTMISAHVASITGMRAWYWDAGKCWPNYGQGNALGLYTDGVHPNDIGRLVLTEMFCRDFCLFQNPAYSVPWKVSAATLAAAGAFATSGGTISGTTRISDATDAAGVTEATGSGAFRTAGGIYAAKAIKSDQGIAIGTDLGAVSSITAYKQLSTAKWSGVISAVVGNGATASGSYNWQGFEGIVYVTYSGASNNTGAMRGGFFQVKESGTGTGTLAKVEGGFSSIELGGSHPVSQASGHASDVTVTGTATAAVDSMYGYRLTNFKAGTGVIANAFGVHIPSTWAGIATATWAFYNDSTAPSLSKGAWTWRPAASVALAANGDLSFEATTDTALTVKYRGSDGITRSAVLVMN